MFVKLFSDYTLFSILLEVEENQMAETTTVGNQRALIPSAQTDHMQESTYFLNLFHLSRMLSSYS